MLLLPTTVLVAVAIHFGRAESDSEDEDGESQPQAYYGVPLGHVTYAFTNLSADLFVADEYSFVLDQFSHRPESSADFNCYSLIVGNTNYLNEDVFVRLTPSKERSHWEMRRRRRRRRRRRSVDELRDNWMVAMMDDEFGTGGLEKRGRRETAVEDITRHESTSAGLPVQTTEATKMLQLAREPLKDVDITFLGTSQPLPIQRNYSASPETSTARSIRYNDDRSTTLAQRLAWQLESYRFDSSHQERRGPGLIVVRPEERRKVAAELRRLQLAEYEHYRSMTTSTAPNWEDGRIVAAEQDLATDRFYDQQHQQLKKKKATLEERTTKPVAKSPTAFVAAAAARAFGRPVIKVDAAIKPTSTHQRHADFEYDHDASEEESESDEEPVDYRDLVRKKEENQKEGKKKSRSRQKSEERRDRMAERQLRNEDSTTTTTTAATGTTTTTATRSTSSPRKLGWFKSPHGKFNKKLITTRPLATTPLPGLEETTTDRHFHGKNSHRASAETREIDEETRWKGRRRFSSATSATTTTVGPVTTVMDEITTKGDDAPSDRDHSQRQHHNHHGHSGSATTAQHRRHHHHHHHHSRRDSGSGEKSTTELTTTTRSTTTTTTTPSPATTTEKTTKHEMTTTIIGGDPLRRPSHEDKEDEDPSKKGEHRHDDKDGGDDRHRHEHHDHDRHHHHHHHHHDRHHHGHHRHKHHDSEEERANGTTTTEKSTSERPRSDRGERERKKEASSDEDKATTVIEKFDGKHIPRGRNMRLYFTLRDDPRKLSDFTWMGVRNECNNRITRLASLKNLMAPRAELVTHLLGPNRLVRSARLRVEDCNTILVPSLYFDPPSRNGDQIFFYVGVGQLPDGVKKLEKAKIVGQSSRSALQRQRGDDLIVKLPPGLRTFDVDFLSLYNEKTSQHIAHVDLPALLVPPCDRLS